MINQLQEETNNLLKLIHKGEYESVELKESLRLKRRTRSGSFCVFQCEWRFLTKNLMIGEKMLEKGS